MALQKAEKFDVVSPFGGDPFVGHLATPITSSNLTKTYLNLLPAYKSGLSPLSEEIETIIQDWLNKNDQIEIISTSQSQHLRENTVFVTVFYRLPQ